MSKKKHNNRNFSNTEAVKTVEMIEPSETFEVIENQNDGKVGKHVREMPEPEVITNEDTAEADPSYDVKVDIHALNIRTGPGMNYDKTGEFTGRGIFTIVETSDGEGSKTGWGRLKSGSGWICLDYTERV